jgi:hypothetical protein
MPESKSLKCLPAEGKVLKRKREIRILFELHLQSIKTSLSRYKSIY